MRRGRPWTLRARLVATLLALAAFGLAAVTVTSTVLLRDYLTDRIDGQLVGLSRVVSAGPRPLPAAGSRPQQILPTDFQITLFDTDGRRTTRLGRDGGGPVLSAGPLPGGPRSVPDTDGAAGWRVLVVTTQDGSAAIAMSLASVQATVVKLLRIELIVSAAVLAVLAVLATSLVRVGLRPLSRIEHTAGLIARGDIDRRIADTDDRSETGRLGGALNLMLTRLAEALREKEQSSSTLRRFIADASHELRTPVTSIRGFAELFRRGGLNRPEEVARTMRRIEDEATRMGLLIDDLLLLAHLDAHRPISREPVDLITLTHDAVLDAQARDPGRPITLEIGNGPTVVVGDDGRLRQVLANMLVNALTHTPTGTPVRVALAVLGPGHRVPAAVSGSPTGLMTAGIVVLEVSDAGQGMTQTQVSQIFDRFYRADNARTRATGGSGLGLSIAASIIDAHGGRIEVYTAPGEGAAFRVELPAAPEQPFLGSRASGLERAAG
ncbi:MAG: sensor histidine kinase [Pseudonocardiaceae bacterium]